MSAKGTALCPLPSDTQFLCTNNSEPQPPFLPPLLSLLLLVNNDGLRGRLEFCGLSVAAHSTSRGRKPPCKDKTLRKTPFSKGTVPHSLAAQTPALPTERARVPSPGPGGERRAVLTDGPDALQQRSPTGGRHSEYGHFRSTGARMQGGYGKRGGPKLRPARSEAVRRSTSDPFWALFIT